MVDCQTMSANFSQYIWIISRRLSLHSKWRTVWQAGNTHCMSSYLCTLTCIHHLLFPINPIHSIPFYKIAYNTIAFTTFIYFFNASKKVISLSKKGDVKSDLHFSKISNCRRFSAMPIGSLAALTW